MKRFSLLILVFLVSAILLAGCAGSDSSIDSTDDSGSGSGNTDGLASLDMNWEPDDFSLVIDVGPGLDYEEPHLLPWDDLEGSTLVRIHKRDTPYRSKWVITTAATSDAPLVVTGISEDGTRPVITGDHAQTLSGLYYLNETRSVIKLGNYTGPGDTDIPSHVFIENLDIRSGRPAYTFTDRYGSTRTYSNNAAAVHIEEGDTITIRGCVLHDCGNGLFSGHFSNDVLISGNHIYDNGIQGSYYEHNTYTESLGIIYEFNHFGPLRNGCGGNNLKDRSAGTVIRFNWIEQGNRALDLVESDYDAFYNDDSYWNTFVYGNILIKTDSASNNQIIHYGGDNDETNHTRYREGTLYLYHNTVISTRASTTNLVNLSTDEATAHIRNNIIYTTAGGGNLALTSGRGDVYLVANWLKQGYRVTHESSSTVDFIENTGNITGETPPFTDEASGDYTPASDSLCLGNSAALPAILEDYPASAQYLRHMDATERLLHGEGADMGAFEVDD